MAPHLNTEKLTSPKSVCRSRRGLKLVRFSNLQKYLFFSPTPRRRGKSAFREFLINAISFCHLAIWNRRHSSTDLGPDAPALKLPFGSAAGSSCATSRHWPLCSPSGTAAENLASKCGPCVYTHTVVAFAQRLPGSSHPKAAPVPRAEVLLSGKTAFRADGEGAAGRRGWHSQPGCVEKC